MSVLTRWFLESRIPISPELVVGMVVAAGGLSILGAYVVAVVLGP
jgi:hypothetical protein